MKTTSETQREALAKYLIALIDEKEQDITTGIEEGLYNKAENAPVLKELREVREKALDLIDANVNVYIYVEGGMIQGASASDQVTVKIYDKDCIENDMAYIVEHGTVEQWNAMIDTETKAGTIKGVL